MRISGRTSGLLATRATMSGLPRDRARQTSSTCPSWSSSVAVHFSSPTYSSLSPRTRRMTSASSSPARDQSAGRKALHAVQGRRDRGARMGRARGSSSAPSPGSSPRAGPGARRRWARAPPACAAKRDRGAGRALRPALVLQEDEGLAGGSEIDRSMLLAGYDRRDPLRVAPSRVLEEPQPEL